MQKYQIRLGYTINHFDDNQKHYSLLINSLNKYNISISNEYSDLLINSKISNRTISIQSVQINDIPHILNDIPIEFILIDIIEYPIKFRLITYLFSFDSNLISKDLTTDQLEITKFANLNNEKRNKYYSEVYRPNSYDENIKNNKISLNQINELRKIIAEKDIEIQEKDKVIQNLKNIM